MDSRDSLYSHILNFKEDFKNGWMTNKFNDTIIEEEFLDYDSKSKFQIRRAIFILISFIYIFEIIFGIFVILPHLIYWIGVGFCFLVHLTLLLTFLKSQNKIWLKIIRYTICVIFIFNLFFITCNLIQMNVDVYRVLRMMYIQMLVKNILNTLFMDYCLSVSIMLALCNFAFFTYYAINLKDQKFQIFFEIILDIILSIVSLFVKKIFDETIRRVFIQKIKFKKLFDYNYNLINCMSGYHLSYYGNKLIYINENLKNIANIKIKSLNEKEEEGTNKISAKKSVYYRFNKKEEVKISEENPNIILNDNHNSNYKHDQSNSHYPICNQGNNANNIYLFNKPIIAVNKRTFNINNKEETKKANDSSSHNYSEEEKDFELYQTTLQSIFWEFKKIGKNSPCKSEKQTNNFSINDQSNENLLNLFSRNRQNNFEINDTFPNKDLYNNNFTEERNKKDIIILNSNDKKNELDVKQKSQNINYLKQKNQNNPEGILNETSYKENNRENAFKSISKIDIIEKVHNNINGKKSVKSKESDFVLDINLDLFDNLQEIINFLVRERNLPNFEQFILLGQFTYKSTEDTGFDLLYNERIQVSKSKNIENAKIVSSTHTSFQKNSPEKCKMRTERENFKRNLTLNNNNEKIREKFNNDFSAYYRVHSRNLALSQPIHFKKIYRKNKKKYINEDEFYEVNEKDNVSCKSNYFHTTKISKKFSALISMPKLSLKKTLENTHSSNIRKNRSLNNNDFSNLIKNEKLNQNTTEKPHDKHKKINFFQVYFRKVNNVIDIIIHDNTLIKKSERDIIENSLKKKILGKIAHEFKTPLNSIIGLISQIKHKFLSKLELNYSHESESSYRIDCESDSVNANLNLIQNLSQYTIYLINDVIQFVSNDEVFEINIQRSKINLRKILNFCYDILKTLIALNESKTIHINPIFSYDENIDSLDVFSDEVRLNQIFLNLISNSVKFTKSGYIKISATYSRFSNEIIVSIEDTGMGMKGEEINNIFNEEESKKIDLNYEHNKMGTGIGLRLSNNIAKRLNHKLEFNTELHKGTIFHLKFDSESFSSNANPHVKSHSSSEINLKLNSPEKEKKHYINSKNNVKNVNPNNNFKTDKFKGNTIYHYNKKNKTLDNTDALGLKRSLSITSMKKKSLFDNEKNLQFLKKNLTNKNDENNFKFLQEQILDPNYSSNIIIDLNEKENEFDSNNCVNELFHEINEKLSIKKNNNQMDDLNNNQNIDDKIIYSIEKNTFSMNNLSEIESQKLEYITEENVTNLIESKDLNFIFDYNKRREKIEMAISSPTNDCNIYDISNNQSNSENLSNCSFGENSKRNLINNISNNIFNINKYIIENPKNSWTQNSKENTINFEIKSIRNENSKISNVNDDNDINIQNKSLKKTSSNMTLNLLEKSIKLSQKSVESRHKSTIKILVVDDNKFIRESLKNTLFSYFKECKKDISLEIIEANDGIDMLKIIIEDKVLNSIKIVFTDENMEVVNGSQAVSFLKTLEKANKIKKNTYILISSMDDYDKNKLFIKNGFDFVFTKPMPKSKLDLVFEKIS